jgi:hypothetical protein
VEGVAAMLAQSNIRHAENSIPKGHRDRGFPVKKPAEQTFFKKNEVFLQVRISQTSNN